ncbi:hypothetical protein JTE90_012248, partial [Oedothorax gibbosus]
SRPRGLFGSFCWLWFSAGVVWWISCAPDKGCKSLADRPGYAIPVPIYFCENPSQGERAWKNHGGKKNPVELDTV